MHKQKQTTQQKNKKQTKPHIMKKIFLNLLALCAFLLSLSPAFAAVGTAFTYQGFLTESGNEVTGIYDFRFNLYAGPADTTTLAPEVIKSGVPVTNGMFMTKIDFGDVFNGEV